jgi:hypothetical protein
MTAGQGYYRLQNPVSAASPQEMLGPYTGTETSFYCNVTADISVLGTEKSDSSRNRPDPAPAWTPRTAWSRRLYLFPCSSYNILVEQAFHVSGSKTTTS